MAILLQTGRAPLSITTDTDNETFTANQNRLDFAVVKSASPTTYAAAGDVIAYTFDVENTGNVTLSNVNVTDPLSGLGTITPASVSLAPAAMQSFTATYTITQADLDNGSVMNTATATGTPPTGMDVTDTDNETITANQTPAISIMKSASPTTYSAAGDMITYTFDVENTGNVTLSNVNVTDMLSGLGAITPSSVSLAPGAMQSFTANYTITQADVDNGSVMNTATATGTPPTGMDVTDTDNETITANQTPAISITKSASPMMATYSAAGDMITYTFDVENDG